MSNHDIDSSDFEMANFMFLLILCSSIWMWITLNVFFLHLLWIQKKLIIKYFSIYDICWTWQCYILQDLTDRMNGDESYVVQQFAMKVLPKVCTWMLIVALMYFTCWVIILYVVLLTGSDFSVDFCGSDKNGVIFNVFCVENLIGKEGISLFFSNVCQTILLMYYKYW